MQFVGIDVAGSKKGQAVAVLTHDLKVTHLLHGLPAEEVADMVISLVGPGAMVAIDSPRSPSANPGGKWGRECDRQVNRQGVRVQWTPPAEYFDQKNHDKEWMAIGFQLFKDFEKLKAEGRVANVIEVFPSASYGRFVELEVALPFHLLDRKAKTDQLDAICCALTGWCFRNRHYEAAGDEEEGQIIVPKF